MSKFTKFRQIWTNRGLDMEIYDYQMSMSAMLDFRNWTFSWAVRHVGFIVTSSYCIGKLSLTLLTLC